MKSRFRAQKKRGILYPTLPVMIFTIIVLLAASLFNGQCSSGNDALSSDVQSANFEDFLPLKLGEKNFTSRIAASDFEKARGLMGVEKLGADETMLFVYDTPQKVSFWMKDTLIPLDIGFFDQNGVLTEVKRMYPMNLNSVPSGRSDIKYALEANADWFKKNSLHTGLSLDSKLLKEALSKRGARK